MFGLPVHARRSPACPRSLSHGPALMVALVVTALSVSLAGVMSPVAAAGAPQLLKDIQRLGASSDPQLAVDVDGTLFFLACRGNDILALWTSNGTPGGTDRVVDVGSCESSWTQAATAAGDRYVYEIDGALWGSDGSVGGTQQLGRVRQRLQPGRQRADWSTSTSTAISCG